MILGITGVGADSVRRCLDWLFREPNLGGQRVRPGLVIMAGYAGALQEHLKVGDVFVANEVADTAGGVWPTTWPGSLPRFPWQPPLHFGRLLSHSSIVATVADKIELGRVHQAHAVDMEASVVASFCAERGVRFGAVRAISDDVHTPISPRLLPLIASGKVSFFRLGKACFRSPGLVKELLTLERHTRLASQHLARVLDALLAHHHPEKLGGVS